jgi:hypothetical protein
MREKNAVICLFEIERVKSASLLIDIIKSQISTHTHTQTKREVECGGGGGEGGRRE